MSRIQDAPDDVVIQIYQHLSVRDVLALRQTCKHAFAVSCLKTLWIFLCTAYITARGIPFPDTDRVNQLSAPELEIATRETLDRDRRLRSGSLHNEYTPKAIVHWRANPNSNISEILFVPDPSGPEGRCIVTVSRGIWCLICLWDVQALGREHEITQTEPKKVDSWSQKGAIFITIAVNSDYRSEASAAVVVNVYGEHLVYILSFFDNAANGYAPRIHVLRTWNPSMPVYGSALLRGDILAVANGRDRAAVVNFHSLEDRVVVLESTTVPDPPRTSNGCLQIQISQKYILVARAQFVEVFDFPADILRTGPVSGSSSADLVIGNGQERIVQHPVDSFSFGWLDRMSISQDTTKPDSFFVFFPQPNDDPWSTHAPTLTFYHLEANPLADESEGTPSPPASQGPPSHIFSETFLASVPLSASASPTSTSSSAFTKLVIGRHHTALWLSPQPRESDSTGLVQMDLNRQGDWPFQTRGIRTWRNFLGDDLVWASFDPRQMKAKTQTDYDGNWTEEGDSKGFILTNRILNSHGDGWIAIAYDEETGRVALGRRDGFVTFLRL
ncbi:hypothetical protein BJ322DRAFT_1114640 [Thelephora terrestris]|uniref:F-box domain-containing protein n=1 Tax=Thelephora terrestris TaxID=56493 RepID=A0A9P6H2J9_9AGAM|nr:hypothetical protein BJ322DRAFT_1114640 [Thelephora terrestris]